MAEITTNQQFQERMFERMRGGMDYFKRSLAMMVHNTSERYVNHTLELLELISDADRAY